MSSKFGLRPEELIKEDPEAELARKILEEKEKASNIQYDPIPEKQAQSPIEEASPSDEKRKSLGKSVSVPDPAVNPALDNGWKNLPLTLLPTQGYYYPAGTNIAIRPADVREIRHYSTIEESDMLDIEEKLNYILDKCSRSYFGDSGLGSYRDLKYEDRFYIILAIRDLTFLRGENRIILKPKTECSKTECPIKAGIELRTGVLSRYEIDGRIQKYYDQERKIYNFVLKKSGRAFPMTIPTIGVMEKLSHFFRSERAKKIGISEDFRKIAPYIFEDWRTINENSVVNAMREIDYWTKEEFSLAFEMSSLLKVGTKPSASLKCNCGAEVTAPISFPRGYKSLFVISDIFGDLL
jgi:hypothetical protein